MIYDPIYVLRSGEMAFTDNSVVLRNWRFAMGGRPGQPSDYQCELLIAVRDHTVAHINARILMLGDEGFSADMSRDALVAQLNCCIGTNLHLVPTPVPPKRFSLKWWRRLFA